MLDIKSINRDMVKQPSSFEMLPKGAYIIKIIDVKTETNKDGKGQHLKIAFDIAEGEYKDFYKKQYDNNTNEDKKWAFDAVYRLNVPNDTTPEWMAQQFFTFLANVEESNKNYTFNGDETKLKGNIVGGLFYIEQSEYNGNIYDHTRLRWTRPADDVRNKKYGKLPKDKLIDGAKKTAAPGGDSEKFMDIPAGVEGDSIPF